MPTNCKKKKHPQFSQLTTQMWSALHATWAMKIRRLRTGSSAINAMNGGTIAAPVTKDMDSSHAICVELEIDNQQTDWGIGCYVVNLPQHWSHLAPCMGQDDEYWDLIVNIISHSAFICRIIITLLKDTYICASLSCVVSRFVNLIKMT